MSPGPEVVSFACPRCRGAVEDRFYGPCQTCRAELRSTLGGEVHAGERTAFEPAMHVTPNGVALKE